jgi:hypothetical protein
VRLLYSLFGSRERDMSNSHLSEKKKIFSYAEAVSLLPEVQRLTRDAAMRVEALKVGNGTPATDLNREIDQVVNDWASTLQERGIEVKGLWLVDFDNGSGYYCWRHPEPGLHFFHSYEDGFGGRIPIQ